MVCSVELRGRQTCIIAPFQEWWVLFKVSTRTNVLESVWVVWVCCNVVLEVLSAGLVFEHSLAYCGIKPNFTCSLSFRILCLGLAAESDWTDGVQQSLPGWLYLRGNCKLRFRLVTAGAWLLHLLWLLHVREPLLCWVKTKIRVDIWTNTIPRRVETVRRWWLVGVGHLVPSVVAGSHGCLVDRVAWTSFQLVLNANILLPRHSLFS